MYHHTQVGWITRIAMPLGALLFIVTALYTGHRGLLWALPLLASALLFAGLAVAFSSLTVTVDPKAVELWFGPGLFRRRIELSKIVRCEPVRNPWFYGWGIRFVGQGWMYNVAGFEAVELSFADGSVFRIGTDEPEELCRAIRENRTELQPGS